MSSGNPPTYFEAIKLDPICPISEDDNPASAPSAPLLPQNQRLTTSNILDQQLRELSQTLKFTTGTGNSSFYIRDTVDCLILKVELNSGILSVIDVSNRSVFTIKKIALGQGNSSRSKFSISHQGKVLEIIEMSGLDASTIKIKDNVEYSVTAHGGRDQDIVITKLVSVLAKIHIPQSGTPSTAFEASMVFPTDSEVTGLDKCLSLAVPMVYMLERSKGIQTAAAQTAAAQTAERVSDDKTLAAVCLGFTLFMLAVIGVIIWLNIATNKPECERKPWLSKCSGRE